MYWGKWGGEWPRPLSPDFVAFRRVQQERGRVHDAARRWFSAKWPAFFATNGQPQPLLGGAANSAMTWPISDEHLHTGESRPRAGLRRYRLLRRQALAHAAAWAQAPSWASCWANGTPRTCSCEGVEYCSRLSDRFRRVLTARLSRARVLHHRTVLGSATKMRKTRPPF
jgi:hypothetical protein